MEHVTTGEPLAEAGAAETKRDRVRRLLLAPLGFRFPRKIDEAEGRKRLDRIADDVAVVLHGAGGCAAIQVS